MKYRLQCETCSVDFPAVVADSREELLVPDFEEMASTAGALNADFFERFHQKHGGHDMRAVQSV